MINRALKTYGFCRKPITDGAETIFEERADGVVRKLVSYALPNGEMVRTFILLPEREGRFPCAVAVHPHLFSYALGKSEVSGYMSMGNPDYAYGLELAREGYAVVCLDLPGFEGRRPMPFNLPEHSENADYEKTLGSYALARGESYQSICLDSLIASLDVLAAEDKADISKAAAVGLGVGGQEAFWLAQADSRIKAVVAPCGLRCIVDMGKEGIRLDMAAVYPGMLEGGDYDALAAASMVPIFLTYPSGDAEYPASCTIKLKNALSPRNNNVFSEVDGFGFDAGTRGRAWRWLNEVL